MNMYELCWNKLVMYWIYPRNRWVVSCEPLPKGDGHWNLPQSFDGLTWGWIKSYYPFGGMNIIEHPYIPFPILTWNRRDFTGFNPKRCLGWSWEMFLGFEGCLQIFWLWGGWSSPVLFCVWKKPPTWHMLESLWWVMVGNHADNHPTSL